MQKIPTSKLLGVMKVGTVVVNTGAPNGCKFIKVRIPGVDLDSTPNDSLPWSGIGRPLFRGGGGTVGMGSIPRVGSKVAGFFDHGSRDSYVALFELDDPTATLPWGADSWGIEDEAGTYVICKVGQTLTIGHQGTTIQIDAGGNVTENVKGNWTVNAGGDAKIIATNIYLND